jgi:hypothetical protein
MILPDIDSRLKPLKTIFNMKYIVALVLSLIIIGLCAPIMFITWSTDGVNTIIDGIEELCGVD